MESDPVHRQTYGGLTWEGCLPPATDSEIANLEARLGVSLPRDYIAVARCCHGGAPVERTAFVYARSPSGDWGSAVAQLLPLRANERNSIERTMEHLAVDAQLPDGLVPVAGDGGGDFICLDYRQGDRVTVAYWSHDRDGPDAVCFLAASFRDFLNRLEPEEDLPEGWDE